MWTSEQRLIKRWDKILTTLLWRLKLCWLEQNFYLYVQKAEGAVTADAKMISLVFFCRHVIVRQLMEKYRTFCRQCVYGLTKQEKCWTELAANYSGKFTSRYPNLNFSDERIMIVIYMQTWVLILHYSGWVNLVYGTVGWKKPQFNSIGQVEGVIK